MTLIAAAGDHLHLAAIRAMLYLADDSTTAPATPGATPTASTDPLGSATDYISAKGIVILGLVAAVALTVAALQEKKVRAFIIAGVFIVALSFLTVPGVWGAAAGNFVTKIFS